MRISYFPFLVLISFHAFIAQAQASEQSTVKNAASIVEIGGSWVHSTYEEPNFMKTSAKIPGVKLATSVLLPSNFYLSGSVNYHKGKSSYDGALLYPGRPNEPYQTDQASTRLLEVEAKLGFKLPLSSPDQHKLIPYLSLGTRLYRSLVAKDIVQNFDGENRATASKHLALGAFYAVKLSEKFTISPEIALGKVFDGRVNYKDGSNFVLKKGPYFLASLKASYLIKNNVSLYTKYTYQDYRFGESKNSIQKQGGVFYEPKSINKDHIIEIGLGFQM